MASAQSTAVFAIVAKDAASGVMRGIGKQMGSLGKTGGAVFKSIAAGAALAASAITAAFGLATKFAKTAIAAAIADDAEQQKLIATLKARGLTTEEATKRTNELIVAGQKLAFTDSETRAAFEVASAFSKKYSAQQKILATAQDLARAKNISLEAATKLVGKAFAGNTGALARYGIQIEKGSKGLEALGSINSKVSGVAAAYAKTASGQFAIVKDSISETVEAIGMAIGGGEGLPTFVRLLQGIRPVLDDLMGEINKNLPNIQKFSRELVEKFLAKLPGYVATAKRELPDLINKAKDFIGSVGGFAKDIASFLGPEGLVTAGIAGLGFKMGGLAGGLGATFATQFIKMGVDPITATITGTLGGAITAGVVQGFGSAVAQAAISKFLGLFRSVPITPSLPVGVPGGAAPAVGGAASTILGVSVAAIAGVAAGAMAVAGVVLAAKGLYDAIYTPAEQEKNMMDNYAKLQARIKANGLAAVTSTAGGPYGSTPAQASSEYLMRGVEAGVVKGFAALPKPEPVGPPITAGVVEGFNLIPETPPIDLKNNLTVNIDGKAVANAIAQYLVPARYRTSGRPQTNPPR